MKHKAAQSSTQKLQLLSGDDYIYLNLTLKKIPSNPRTNPYRIALPHPILDSSSQLCLIIDDRPKSTTPPSDEIKKLIKSQNIPISKVVKVSKLKTNYKPFEAKRKLCDSYDLFLVDKRVVHLLPKLIGKQFFKKKKLPLGVDLGKKNLKLKVEMALGSALMYVRSGTCCVMKVGKVEMEKNEIVDNVFDAIKGAVDRVSKKWDGVRSLHLKFSDSVALPIYQAMPDVKLKIEGLKDSKEGVELMKISDDDGDVKEMSGVKEGRSGKKKKGRIHEVNYMDIGEGLGSDDDDEIEQVKSENNDEFVGQKEMEENLMDESDDDETNKTGKEELDVDETVGKKKSKDKALNVKKKAKSEKNVGKKPKKNGKEEVADTQGKKKSEVGRKPSERIAKKRASAK